MINVNLLHKHIAKSFDYHYVFTVYIFYSHIPNSMRVMVKRELKHYEPCYVEIVADCRELTELRVEPMEVLSQKFIKTFKQWDLGNNRGEGNVY